MKEQKEPSREKRKKPLLLLFLTFLEIGAFTFGGGYAMIPLIRREIVEKRHWLTDDDILEIIAVAESTPGPIAVNAATFVGYRTGGFFGAFLATFGVVLPSFLIIAALSFVLDAFQEARAVRYAFVGIRAGVLALILKALVSMAAKNPRDIVSCLIMVAAFIAVAVFRANVLLVIVGCAAAGLLSSAVAEKRSAK